MGLRSLTLTARIFLLFRRIFFFSVVANYHRESCLFNVVLFSLLTGSKSFNSPKGHAHHDDGVCDMTIFSQFGTRWLFGEVPVGAILSIRTKSCLLISLVDWWFIFLFLKKWVACMVPSNCSFIYMSGFHPWNKLIWTHSVAGKDRRR